MTLRNDRAMMASRTEAPDSLDFFPSPPWWGRALGDGLARLGLPIGETCEEPAAGEGHLAHGLAEVWGQVRASDIHAHARRAGAPVIRTADYLARSDWLGVRRPDWTATNPPFGDRIEAFIRRASARSRIGAAMLLQLGQMEGAARLRLFADCGLYAVIVLPRKGSGLRKGLWQPGLSTATRYAWFVFLRPGVVDGWRGFEGEARTIWVDWKASDRLTRESDQAFAGLFVPDARCEAA